MRQHRARTFHRRFLAGFLLLMLVLLSRTEAADLEARFEQANRLYEQGKFSEAANAYETIVKSGRRSPALFFNLGNAYFKDGQLGRALFHFRMAERMVPRDPDVQANLRLTRERISSAAFNNPSPWDRFLGYFTLNELTAFCAILFWVWTCLFIASRYRPSIAPRIRGIGLTVGIVLCAALILLMFSFAAARSKTAIVVTRGATVHLGPLAESQAAFTAEDGAELTMLAQREDWFQVRDQSNRSGWISSTNVLIFPPRR